ncbi:Uncharacterised protein [Vibrio cholerae]|nr:Uncharacterised protein [Vibrio cholerae]
MRAFASKAELSSANAKEASCSFIALAISGYTEVELIITSF